MSEFFYRSQSSEVLKVVRNQSKTTRTKTTLLIFPSEILTLICVPILMADDVLFEETESLRFLGMYLF